MLKVELKMFWELGLSAVCIEITSMFFQNRILLPISISRFWDIGNKLKKNKTDKFC